MIDLTKYDVSSQDEVEVEEIKPSSKKPRRQFDYEAVEYNPRLEMEIDNIK